MEPFHDSKSIPDAISCVTADGLELLARRIKETKILKDHVTIAMDWQKRIEELGVRWDHYKVANSVMDQKEALAAKAATKDKAAEAARLPLDSSGLLF